MNRERLYRWFLYTSGFLASVLVIEIVQVAQMYASIGQNIGIVSGVWLVGLCLMHTLLLVGLKKQMTSAAVVQFIYCIGLISTSGFVEGHVLVTPLAKGVAACVFMVLFLRWRHFL